MNEEQANPDDATAAAGENKGSESNNEKRADDYYSVDDPKKDFNTSIGDGEMHDEGLVGDGSVSNDDGTFSDGSTTEQDEAENHDSEG